MSANPPEQSIQLREILILLVVLVVGVFAWSNYHVYQRVHTPLKTATNNLRRLAAAAQSYMMEKNQTQAAFTDLVGTASDKFLRSITPEADETYTSLIILQGESQITLSSASLGTITYNM